MQEKLATFNPTPEQNENLNTLWKKYGDDSVSPEKELSAKKMLEKIINALRNAFNAIEHENIDAVLFSYKKNKDDPDKILSAISDILKNN